MSKESETTKELQDTIKELNATVKELSALLKEQQKSNAKQQKSIAELQEKLSNAYEQLYLMRQRHFGISSEKRIVVDPNQPNLFNLDQIEQADAPFSDAAKPKKKIKS